MAKAYVYTLNDSIVDQICEITGEDKKQVSKILVYINPKDGEVTVFVGRIEDDE